MRSCSFFLFAQVSKSFEVSSGQCTYHKNLIVESGEQVCFSKKPVVECGSTCKPEGYSQKRVDYTCLSRNKTARYTYIYIYTILLVLPQLQS